MLISAWEHDWILDVDMLNSVTFLKTLMLFFQVNSETSSLLGSVKMHLQVTRLVLSPANCIPTP